MFNVDPEKIIMTILAITALGLVFAKAGDFNTVTKALGSNFNPLLTTLQGGQ